MFDRICVCFVTFPWPLLRLCKFVDDFDLARLQVHCTFAEQIYRTCHVYVKVFDKYEKIWNTGKLNGNTPLTSKSSTGSNMLSEVFDKWFPDKFTDFKWASDSNISIGNTSISATDSVRNFGKSCKYRKFQRRKFITSITQLMECLLHL